MCFSHSLSLSLSLALSRSLYHKHKNTRARTHTSKEKADQIFICLSGLKLWLGPFTAAGSLLMMRGSCSPRGRGNTNKKTDRLIDTNEQVHTHHTYKYTRTHTWRIQAVFANTLNLAKLKYTVGCMSGRGYQSKNTQKSSKIAVMISVILAFASLKQRAPHFSSRLQKLEYFH